MVKITERALVAWTIREDRPFEVDILKDEAIVNAALRELKIREQGLRRYCEIMNCVLPQDRDFQRRFNSFYRVRRNEGWRQYFFEIMSETQNKDNKDFYTILTQIYNRTGKLEASFSSKMLATFNPNMPIWDSRVAKIIGIRLPKGETPEERLEKASDEYDFICNWYKYLFVLEKTMAEDLIKKFNACFPEYKNISKVKKIDFILWAIPKEMVC